MVTLLDEETKIDQDYQYIKCTKSEGKDALLHRYVAGSAPGRYQKLNSEDSAGIIPLDVALPRNFVSWSKLLPNEILSQMAESFQMGHFLCMVFHWDFVVKKGVNIVSLKEKSNIHMMFKDVDMLTHIKLNQYLHRRKIKIQAA